MFARSTLPFAILLILAAFFQTTSASASSFPSRIAGKRRGQVAKRTGLSSVISASASASAFASASAISSTGFIAATTPNLPVPSPFPSPFDGTLDESLSSTCLSFFSYFLTAPTFSSCRPLSFLLSSSTAFATIAASNSTQLTALLQATANTDISSDECEAWMEKNGGILASRCASDLKAGNALVQQAAAGFETYSLMRSSGTLVSPTTSAFCYVEAISSTSPSDAYYWSLFSGLSLPKSTKPSCSSCTQSLMDLYAGSAFNATLSLSGVYGSAANLTNEACGSDFARTVAVVTSTIQTTSASSRTLSLPLFAPLFLLAALSSTLL